MTELALDCGAATDTGLVRDRNEDRYWMDPDRGVFLVVDGVGGHAAGERAAEIAVSAICEALDGDRAGPAAGRVRRAIAAANNRIYAEALDHPEWAGMACVLTLALVEPFPAQPCLAGPLAVEPHLAKPSAGRDAAAGEEAPTTGEPTQSLALAGAITHVTVGHVGDSRLYQIEGGAIRKVTSDHSPVGQMEDEGEIAEEEAMAHPRRNQVYRDVGSCPRGANEEDFIELCQCELRRDAAMLLCSDGLSDHLTSRRIREIAERYAGNAAQTVRHLVDAANQAGGRDNITAIFVAGPEFRGRSGATRPRLGVTRIRVRPRVWRGRIAFLSYGLLLGMLLWAILRVRG